MNPKVLSMMLLLTSMQVVAQPDRAIASFNASRLAAGSAELRSVEAAGKKLRSDELLLVSFRYPVSHADLAQAINSSTVSARGLYWCVPQGGVYGYHFGATEELKVAFTRGKEQIVSAGKAMQAMGGGALGAAPPQPVADLCGVDVVGTADGLSRFVRALGQGALIAEASTLSKRRYPLNAIEGTRK